MASGSRSIAGNFGDGSINISGDNNVVNQAAAAAPAQSAYLALVRQIAPPTLIGREPEMADLAAFCTDPGSGSYAWWQAVAWSGKSALMSTFALQPPGGVRVVTFFVTALRR